MVDLLGAGDLSPSTKDDAELREADTVRQTRSVPFAPSSVLATDAAAPTRRTRLRFMPYRRRGGHDTERRSPVREAVPDHLERQFADVISAVEALREEIRNSDRERKESEGVRDKQHKELVRMIQTLQGTSTQMHMDDPFHYEAPRVTPQQGLETSQQGTAALPRKDAVPLPQHDTIVGVSDVEQS
ncbi:hypothetical protein Q3G72_032654 [Acer saccharum]|nr:hypothetical protein Q3G72_032654 [Acer saccharum]